MKLVVLFSREHADADSSPAAKPRATARVMFDSAGPPGHTPFRSSRFVTPAEDSEELQVSHLISVPLSISQAPASKFICASSSLWHAPVTAVPVCEPAWWIKGALTSRNSCRVLLTGIQKRQRQLRRMELLRCATQRPQLKWQTYHRLAIAQRHICSRLCRQSRSA